MQVTIHTIDTSHKLTGVNSELTSGHQTIDQTIDYGFKLQCCCINLFMMLN